MTDVLEDNTFLLPTLQHQFRLGQWLGLGEKEKNTLALQCVSIDFESKPGKNNSFFYSHEITFTFEDDRAGRTTNAIHKIPVGSPQIRIEAMDGGPTPVSFINLNTARVQSINYSLNYAKSTAAQYVVKVVVDNIDRTID